MGLADVTTDIRNLAQDMAASHADRAASHAERGEYLEALSHEIREMIQTFQKEHAERKVEVTQTLGSFMENLHREVHHFMKEVNKFMKELHSENAQKQGEVNDLLTGFQQDTKDVRKENTQRQREVNKLLEGIQKEMEGFEKENMERHHEVSKMAGAVKEMWATIARAKGGVKKVSACNLTEAKETKPAGREKKKSRRAGSILTK